MYRQNKHIILPVSELIAIQFSRWFALIIDDWLIEAEQVKTLKYMSA